MKKSFILLTLSLFALSFAQPGMGKMRDCPMGDTKCEFRKAGQFKGPDMMFANLGVDSLTQQKLKTLFINSKKEKEVLWVEMDQKKLELKKLLLEGKTDMKLIKANVDARSKIWASLQIKEFEKDAEVRKLLNDQQWEVYLMHRIHRLDKGDGAGPSNKNRKGGKGQKNGANW
jgi:hypothetical protein